MLNISPNESIYFDMYTWGLKQVPYEEIVAECATVGKQIRQKDHDNYWRGYYKSALKSERNIFSISRPWENKVDKLDMKLSDYEKNPFAGSPPIYQRWVPCSANNKPLIKWSQGCLMYDDALAYTNQVYMAENLRGTQYVVVDCDGDHDDSRLDLETIFELWQYTNITHALVKPKQVKDYPGYEASGCTIPASFHLTFKTDRLIPTIHAPWAHVDILGNQNNQLRYIKKKQWNGREPAELTEDIYQDIVDYLRRRREESQCQ